MRKCWPVLKKLPSHCGCCCLQACCCFLFLSWVNFGLSSRLFILEWLAQSCSDRLVKDSDGRFSRLTYEGKQSNISCLSKVHHDSWTVNHFHFQVRRRLARLKRSGSSVPVKSVHTSQTHYWPDFCQRWLRSRLPLWLERWAVCPECWTTQWKMSPTISFKMLIFHGWNESLSCWRDVKGQKRGRNLPHQVFAHICVIISIPDLFEISDFKKNDTCIWNHH